MLKDFGRDLKFLRESKNITIAEISAETRINPKFFTNIEAGIFDFQPETYIRAFLKEYAQIIGEDQSQILHEYERAKSGYYSRRFTENDEKVKSSEPALLQNNMGDFGTMQPDSEDISSSALEDAALSASSGTSAESQGKSRPSYGYVPGSDYDAIKARQRKRRNQKIWIGGIVLIVAAGIIFMINYFNRTSGKQSSDIKPKSFDEISEDYESRMKTKNETETDSVNKLSALPKSDSLMLTIKASREVRVKIYLDENQLIEEIIPAGDSLSIKAAQQFRFSAAANSSVELLLNGNPLRKPKSITGTSIKNLIIRKGGVVEQ